MRDYLPITFILYVLCVRTEDILSEFLSIRLPRSIGLSKGHAIDDRDALSPQLDIMVFDALQTVLYRPNPGSTFIPYDSLLAWIEVKSILTKRGLHNAFAAAMRTKSLHRSQVVIGPMLLYKDLHHTHSFLRLRVT